MDVEMESQDDINELESRLYAQVHHEVVDGSSIQSTPTVAEHNFVDRPVDKTPKPRYWNKRNFPRNINPFASRKQFQKVFERNVLVEDADIEEYRRNTSCLNIGGVIPVASGGNPNQNGSSSNTYDKKKHNINSARARSNTLFNEKLAKMTNAIKYQLKKAKAAQVRGKQVEISSKASVETIVVDSSNEESDIEEVPLPAPPTVIIDSSGESDKEVSEDIRAFAKPRDLKSTNRKQIRDSPRCSSPSSVISDDFIRHADRSRILQDKSDDDFLYLADAPNNVSRREREKETELGSDQSNKTSSKGNKSGTNYHVTQSTFRAVDVYESESSDIPESIYAKEKLMITEKVLSSDIERIDVLQRAKRLRKRKKSGSAKESEVNVDSSCSGNEEDSEKSGLPFISRGEAVENCKDKSKRNLQIVPDVNSDNEFMNLLAAISKGKSQDDMESDKSAPSDEEITARKIAEKLLKKEDDDILDISEEKSEAVPLGTTLEIEKVLEEIDSFKEEVKNAEEEQEEYQQSIEDFSIASLVANAEQRDKSIVLNNNDDLHVVLSNNAYVGWNEEMTRFYNMSWGQENFNVKQLKKQMNRHSKWLICNEDRFFMGRTFSKYKCFNCCEFGHIRRRCPKPKKDLICYMCGDIGHLEPRCPKTICLRCGRKSRTFVKSCHVCQQQNRLICPICKVRGHGVELCPDKWRRYHSTTAPNEYPKKEEYSKRKYCCICAGIGHYPEHCKSCARFPEYPTFVTEIKSHAKSYDDDLLKNSLARDVTGYSLMYVPDDKISFTFTSKVTPTQYYGRFLQAVGLDHLLSRKRKILDKQTKLQCEGEPRNKKNYVLNPFARNKHSLQHDDDIKLNISSNTRMNEGNILKPTKTLELQRSSRNKSKISTRTFLENKRQRGISDMETSDVIDVDKGVPCEAKIYLANFHTKYLYSPKGNEFLMEISRKFDVKAKLASLSVGSVLVIEGFPNNQDKFHNVLLKRFRNLSNESNLKQLERSQKLPRKKSILISFIEGYILQLRKNLGNVNDLHAKLKICCTQQTKSSWKIAEKARKTLNMILIGQAGLKEGRTHLRALLKKIQQLRQEESMKIVPDEVRNEIEEHWKYIFSSQHRNNYEELIQQYLELTKKNELTNFHMCATLEQFLEVLNKKDKIDEQKLPGSPEFKNITSSTPIRAKPPAENQSMKPEIAPSKKEESPEPCEPILEELPKTESFVSNKIIEVNKQWERNYEGLLCEIEQNQQANTGSNRALEPSMFWSRESLRFIDECLSGNPSPDMARKLRRIQNRAIHGALSHNEYETIKKIYNILKGKCD